MQHKSKLSVISDLLSSLAHNRSNARLRKKSDYDVYSEEIHFAARRVELKMPLVTFWRTFIEVLQALAFFGFCDNEER